MKDHEESFHHPDDEKLGECFTPAAMRIATTLMMKNFRGVFNANSHVVDPHPKRWKTPLVSSTLMIQQMIPR